MGRQALAAALGAALAAGALAAAEFETWTDEALGVACEVPPGYELWEPGPEEAAPARVAKLEWAGGAYDRLRVLVVRREARYESAAVAAGLFQRRLGAAACEAEGEALSPAELAAAAAAEGIRAAYAPSDGGEERRLEVLFLAGGEWRYRVEVSYPAASEPQLGAVATRILTTFRILPAGEAAGEGPAGTGGADEKAPSE